MRSGSGDRISKSKIYLGYGFGNIADNIYYQFTSSYQFVFLTTVVGLSADNAGTVTLVTMVVDAFACTFVGRFSDGLRSKYGRRRPLIFVGAFLLPAFFFLNYITVMASEGIRMLYYLSVGSLYWTSFAIFYVPFIALGADVASDYDERIKMQTFIRIMSTIGGILGSALPMLAIERFQDFGMSMENSWLFFTFLMTFIGSVGILISWRSTRGCERVPKEKPIPQGFSDTMRDYREIMSLKPYRIMMYTKMLMTSAYGMYASTLLFFVKFCIGGDPEWLSGLYLSTNIASLPFIAIIGYGALYFGKKRQLMAGFLLASAVAFIMYFTGMNSFLILLFYSLVLAYSQATFWQLCYANFYDVTDLDEYRSGKRREGNLMALQAFVGTVGTALAHKGIAKLLSISGFDGTLAVQTPGAVEMIRTIFILLPAAAYLAAALLMSRYRINKENFALLKEAIYRRNTDLPPLGEDELALIENMYH